MAYLSIVLYCICMLYYDYVCTMYALAKYYSQVLSELVHKSLVRTGGEEAQGTAEFCLMFDRFLTASMCHLIILTGKTKRKAFQAINRPLTLDLGG